MSANGNAPGESDLVSIEVPQFGVMVQDGPDGLPYLGIQVTTSGTLHQFFLCVPGDADLHARKWHQQILTAGREARKREGKANLIIPTGGEVNAISKAQGRK
jgi:hypothetical protein